ncbi:MAG: DUF4169 family protein [Hansschlegelia sp.]
MRREKKRLAREASARVAAENRVRFGAKRVDDELSAARRASAERMLDGHRRENGGDADA